jgi:NAD+ diphosphatase
VTDGPLGPLALAGSPVDRATRWRKDTAWLAAAWADPSTRVLRFHAGRTLVRGAGLAPVGSSEAGEGERLLLGVDEVGVAWFATLEPTPPEVPGGLALAGLREVGAALSDRDAGLLVQAVALANWHAANGRCARCGAPTTVEAAGHLRRCPDCAAEQFPRTDPAVIVLVTDGAGRALLGHNQQWPPNRYSTLAGFVEPGESAEHAVVREIKEEAGVDVVEVCYVGSQPWPFPGSLMLGFVARALDANAVRVDGEELSDARWFSQAELRAAVAAGEVVVPPSFSIARRLVETWYGGPLPDGPGSW